MKNHILQESLRPEGMRCYQRSEMGENVPFRAVAQEDTQACFGGGSNPTVYLKDVTGAFGENQAKTDVTLKKRNRPAPGSPTQLAQARAGIVTADMAYVATRENLNLEHFAQEVETMTNVALRHKLQAVLKHTKEAVLLYEKKRLILSPIWPYRKKLGIAFGFSMIPKGSHLRMSHISDKHSLS